MKPERKRVRKGDSHMDDHPKPSDLIMNRLKFSERRMEDRTSVVYTHLDDL